MIKVHRHRSHNRTRKQRKGSTHVIHILLKPVDSTSQISNSNKTIHQKMKNKLSNINTSQQLSSISQHEPITKHTVPINSNELMVSQKEISTFSEIYRDVHSYSTKSIVSMFPKKIKPFHKQLFTSNRYDYNIKQENIIENTHKIKKKERHYICRKFRLGYSLCCCWTAILTALFLLGCLAAILTYFLTRQKVITTTTTTTTTTSVTTTTSTTTSTTSTSTSSTSTSSTTSTSTTSTTTTTAGPCAPVNIGSMSTLLSATSGDTSAFKCQVYSWTPAASGTVTLAFQFRHDPGLWYLDDVSVFDGTNEKIVNGDFETGSLSPQWTKSAPNGSCTCCITARVDNITGGVVPKSGSQYVIDGSNNCISQISQSFTVTLGQVYTISFWLRDGGGIGQKVFIATIS
ncbi:hypothetical protein I4U23_027250 [Adineta vaga]|nr:hypothetical protein I4U23_027250 [Adineta vaga]